MIFLLRTPPIESRPESAGRSSDPFRVPRVQRAWPTLHTLLYNIYHKIDNYYSLSLSRRLPAPLKNRISRFISLRSKRVSMAKAKTSTFTITEQVINTGPVSVGIISIGSLIDVGDAQALEVLEVDYIYQDWDGGAYTPFGSNAPFTGTAAACVQLMDRNSSALISAADNNLISSSNLNWDVDGGATSAADFYPDDFKTREGRFVVNDEMYVVMDSSGSYNQGHQLRVTLRIRARVVKLGTKDWMAISLETVQNE